MSKKYLLLFDVQNASVKCTLRPVFHIARNRNIYIYLYVYTEYKNHPSQTSYMKFSELRSKCKYFSKRGRYQYLSNVQKNLSTNPRGFWNYIKTKRNNNELPLVMNFNEDNSEDICNAFANYFSSVYISPNSTIASHQTNINQNAHINLSSLNILLAEVFEGLSNLSLDKAYGPYKHIFNYCTFLLFVDDLKMCIKVSSVYDQKRLQSDFVKFSNWCTMNQLNINIDKCAVILFTRRKNRLIYN